MVHIVPGLHVPPQPSLGVLPQARVEGGSHVGAQHEPPRQRSPLGHIVPFGHAAQPAGSLGSTPHASDVADIHVGQHEPAVHVDPLVHIVPGLHIRQTAPEASRRSGIAVPHATLLVDGHRGQHAPPMQSEPDAHIVPVPHVRHTVPSAACTAGIGAPHATVDALAQLPQQTRSSADVVPGGLRQVVPAAQRAPKPVHVRHAGDGIGSPQSTALADGHVAQHMPVVPPVHALPVPQPEVP
jgi:hypothetical protein